MKLHLLISDAGDGSYHPNFVLDQTVLDRLQDLYDRDLMDYANGIGVDGDGFHYESIEVPDGSTAVSLGISLFTHEDIDDMGLE